MPARLSTTSKDTGPWRIESRGHELHSYPHKDERSASAPLKTDRESGVEYYETPRAGAIKRLLILMRPQSEMIFYSIMDGEVEKCELKAGL